MYKRLTESQSIISQLTRITDFYIYILSIFRYFYLHTQVSIVISIPEYVFDFILNFSSTVKLDKLLTFLREFSLRKEENRT